MVYGELDISKIILALPFLLLLVSVLGPGVTNTAGSDTSNGDADHLQDKVRCPELPRHAELQQWGQLALLLHRNKTIDVDTKDRWGKTALYYVSKHGYIAL